MSDSVVKLWDSGRAPPRGPAPPPPPKPPDGEPPVSEDPFASAPFHCLGASDSGRYWFLDHDGGLTDLTSRDLGAWTTLYQLCGGHNEWLVRHFRRFDRDGNPVDDFNIKQAVAAIMQQSSAQPRFDPTMPRRRYGVWPIAGGHALHLGETVIWNGEPERSGFMRAGALWVQLAGRAAPGEPAPVDRGLALEALLNTWHWQDAENGAALMLGLAVSGWIAGALRWRPHGLVIGEGGTGKTTLLRDLLAPLCPLTRYMNDYTEPGLRQLLSETAAAMILDEAEADASSESRLRRTIEMLRRASSGSGVQSVKGSSDHTAKQFTITGSAIMGAILPPPLEPQDAMRFTVLVLKQLTAAADDGAIAAFALKEGPGLWGRALARLDDVLALIPALRDRLVSRGASVRLADQLATIAGCRWIMVSDDMPNLAEPEELDEPLAVVRELAKQDLGNAVDSGGNMALQRLLTTPVDMVGDKLTLGQVLQRFRMAQWYLEADAPPIADPAAAAFAVEERESRVAEHAKLGELLESYGVRWRVCRAAATAENPAPPGLFVTTAAHPRLMRAFDGTAWTGRRWGAAFEQLPGVLSGRALTAQRIGGVVVRCVWLPESACPPIVDG